jgi:hypothetical protein
MRKGLRIDNALCLAAISAVVLLSACGNAATSSSATPGSAPTSSFGGNADQRVDAWFVDGGHAELTSLIDALDAVGHAPDTSAGLGAACIKLAGAVTSAQAAPAVPDAAAQSSLAGLLTDYATAAADCRTWASSHDASMMTKSAAAISAGSADLRKFEAETADAQTRQLQSEETSKCRQLYQAWENGPAKPEISQFLTALGALLTADSGSSIPATTAAAEKAAQAAGQLTGAPVPACADPAGDFAEIISTVRAAAAGAGPANSQSAAALALEPLKGLPALEAGFTAEVKAAT